MTTIKERNDAMLLQIGIPALLAFLAGAVLFFLLWQVVFQLDWWVAAIIAVVFAILVGLGLYFWVEPAVLNWMATQPPQQQGLNQPPAGNTPQAPKSPTDTTLFGSGSCISNGTTYSLIADSSAVWNDQATLKALANDGGTCTVKINKQGWLWAVSATSITDDGQGMDAGMAIPVKPGTYVFEFSAKGGKNDSNGLLFKDNMQPNAATNIAFATGTCDVNGTTYTLSYDTTAIWEEGELLTNLQKYGGTCNVVTNQSGWYWSVDGVIMHNETTRMANGQRLTAEAGTWVFTYNGGSVNNGFIIRNNVPYGQ